MSARVALLAVLLSFIAVPSTAQIFSWDPLKDVENALPQGVPNEGKIIQARDQVREMTQAAVVLNRATWRAPRTTSQAGRLSRRSDPKSNAAT